tara:strand:- start:7428 stop:9257 length:1830 start_codon:yes stop_codon:yes gene_type:complete
MATSVNRPKDSLNKKASFDIIINGNTLGSSYRICKIFTKKELNKISRSFIEIYGGDSDKNEFKEIEDSIFDTGNEVIIKMGYDQSNVKVFEGIIESCSVNLHSGYQSNPEKSVLKIECVDKAIKLSNSFTNEIFEQMTDSEIIKKIVSSVSGLSTKIVDLEQEHEFFSKYNSNDWDFILERASSNGMVVINSNNNLSFINPSYEKKSELTISNSGYTYSFQAKQKSENQIKKLVINSIDSFNNEKVSKEVNEPLNKLISADELAKSELDNFSPDEVVLNYATDLTYDEIDEIGFSKLKMLRLNRIFGKSSFRGVPDLDINSVVTFEGFGNKFDGDVFVSSVSHTLSEGEVTSEISFGFRDSISSERGLTKNQPFNKISGLHIGKISEIEKDPKNQFRVKVVIPELKSINNNIWDNIFENGIWAKLSQCYVSEDSGFFFYPEIGTQVIVSFLSENPTQPVVLGSLYTNENKPYNEINNLNNYKAIVLKNKMKIEFDQENEKLSISTEKGNEIKLDEKNTEISIKDANDNEISISGDNIFLKCKSDIKLDSSNIIMNASGNIKLDSKSDLNFTAANIDNNAKIKFSAKGSAGTEISSSSVTTLKGSIVQIN